MCQSVSKYFASIVLFVAQNNPMLGYKIPGEEAASQKQTELLNKLIMNLSSKSKDPQIKVLIAD